MRVMKFGVYNDARGSEQANCVVARIVTANSETTAPSICEDHRV
jgi:hypothetical protein